ncbi:hypothetical protein [Saccharopolyspora rhizosphaerae]|nr:hypothetical protein [Saccharopolyspora rhizosphaerae]
MDSNARLANLPATGDARYEVLHIRELLTQRRVIDHGRRTTCACRREM